MTAGKLVAAVLMSLVCGLAAPAGAAMKEDTSPASPSDLTVEQLVTLLQAHREPSIAFEEATYSSLLTEPLKTKGVLRFTPPAVLEKQVNEPYRERYVIDGDRVTVESERRRLKKTLSLEDYPALRSFVEAFRASFTGDVGRLQQIYETTVGGTSARWTLLLRPRDQTGKSIVDYILFSGSDGRIAQIAMRMPDGDRSVMTLRQGKGP